MQNRDMDEQFVPVLIDPLTMIASHLAHAQSLVVHNESRAIEARKQRDDALAAVRSLHDTIVQCADALNKLASPDEVAALIEEARKRYA